MKKCVIVCLFLIFIFPTSNALSVNFYWAFLFSDHSKDINGATDYKMAATVGVDSDSVAVTLDFPDKGTQIELDPWGPHVWDPTWYEYGKIIYNPPPGDWYKTSYQFLVDDGTSSPLFSNVTNNIFPMDFVQADISGGKHPTITWEPVDFADRYQIRFFDPVTGERLFEESIDEDGSTSYSYKYLGNLFEEYEKLRIRISARDYDNGQIVNRSHVSYEHSAVPSQLESITTGDLNNDGSDDLAVVTASDQVRYSTDFTTWTDITGEFETIVCGDFNGDGNDDLAGVNSIGQVWYTTDLSSWTNIPGTVAAIVTGDFDNDGNDDIAGINPDGMISKIFYTTDLSTWTPIPGLITTIVTGDLDGDGDDDIAGINPDGVISKIFYTTDLSTWTPIPGLITTIVTGDLDGDGDYDIAGINPNGVMSKIFYTTDLSNWTPIPGLITSIVTGDFDGDDDDDIAGINPNGVSAKIFYTNDLVNWNIIPGALEMITTGDLNADGRDDLAGINSSGMTWYTTDLSAWTNIP